MANLPQINCKHPGCQRLAVKNGLCERHQGTGWQRDKSRQAMYDHRWQRASKAFLAEHPWCAKCMKQGTYTPAVVVDHKKPHKGNATLFWSTANWQGLCKRCHDAKTAKETGGFGSTKA